MNQQTVYNFATETDSVTDLIRRIPDKKFNIFREVSGRYFGPHNDYMNDAKNNLRIDMVLIPTGIFEDGYDLGIIGVECKRSGITYGPAISQVIDYHSTIWCIPGNFQVKLNYIFIWPMDVVNGPLASVMVQNRIGILNCGSNNDSLMFRQADGRRILTIKTYGEINFSSINSGLKIGSRS